jgi:GT2 family glycosyltransferase
MNILFVMVIYKEKIFNCDSYKSIISEYPNIPLYVFDNSPVTQHNTDELNKNIKYVSDTTNPGLSYAYNRAAEYAKDNGLEWLLLMDQDTLFCSNLLEAYQKAISENPDIKIFVPNILAGKQLLSPTRIKLFNRNRKNVCGKLLLSEYNAINSGMLINVDAMLDVGGYNEKVWLDYSDYEFLNRMRKHGNCYFYAVDKVCKQSFSDKIQDKNQKLERYITFCKCLRNCEKETIKKKMFFFYQASKRMLSLFIKTVSLRPINIFINNYLFEKT